MTLVSTQTLSCSGCVTRPKCLNASVPQCSVPLRHIRWYLYPGLFCRHNSFESKMHSSLYITHFAGLCPGCVVAGEGNSVQCHLVGHHTGKAQVQGLLLCLPPPHCLLWQFQKMRLMQKEIDRNVLYTQTHGMTIEGHIYPYKIEGFGHSPAESSRSLTSLECVSLSI